MRIGVIVVASAVLALMAAAALYAPMHASGYRSPPTPTDAKEAYYQQRFRFDYVSRLQELDKDPLEWQCHEGSPDRARVYQSGCLAEFVSDYSLGERDGSVQLHVRGDGMFLFDSHGAKYGRHALTGAQAANVRAMLLERLPPLPSQTPGGTLPPSTDAIEACIRGKPLFVLRNSFDPGVETLASDVLKASGLDTDFTTHLRCY